MLFDTIIKNVEVFDGTGEQSFCADVATEMEKRRNWQNRREDCSQLVEGARLSISSWIHRCTHTRRYQCYSLPRLPTKDQPRCDNQAIVGKNRGISASPTVLAGDPPDPMNLLGAQADFKYPTLPRMQQAVEQAQPAVNVAALLAATPHCVTKRWTTYNAPQGKRRRNCSNAKQPWFSDGAGRIGLEFWFGFTQVRSKANANEVMQRQSAV